jgi:predicted DNA-binding protein (MmcQ/YjbR family)
MRLDRIKAFALSLPSATVVQQWGETLVFKIGGKMFLLLSLDAGTLDRLSFKCSPADFQTLTRDGDGIVPAPYLARASWVALEDVGLLPEAELHERIRASYALVRARLPKKVQAGLIPG